jgi:hypothetical protein
MATNKLFLFVSASHWNMLLKKIHSYVFKYESLLETVVSSIEKIMEVNEIQCTLYEYIESRLM